ncbi:hypothetical protein AX17_005133 [Amanita inopinata Kibby_2008]|nr:hypothetical protein AX17_005133 [Amanita inopinata Kibby_2008]
MTICQDCGLDFPLLSDATSICQKCQMLEGQSGVEKVAIKAKGQCQACSLVYTNLEQPLCNACCNFYVVDEEAIPQSILKLNGAMEQLGSYQKSDVASEIFELAAGFQSVASDNRLGCPRTQNTSLQKAALSRFKEPAPGLSKGKTLLAEMKAAKDDSGRIKITAGLYLISKNKSGTEIMKKVMLLNC